VILTPALAKALVGVLSAHVKEYERDNGVIAFPETVKRAFIERTEKAKAELEEIQPVAEPAEN
jgi:hypothetical protein